MPDQARRGGHAWAVAAPILVAAIAWILGLLIFEMFGARYLRGFFARLLHLIR